MAMTAMQCDELCIESLAGKLGSPCLVLSDSRRPAPEIALQVGMVMPEAADSLALSPIGQKQRKPEICWATWQAKSRGWQWSFDCVSTNLPKLGAVDSGVEGRLRVSCRGMVQTGRAK